MKKSFSKFAFSVASNIMLLLDLSGRMFDTFSDEIKYFNVDYQSLDVKFSDFNFAFSLSIWLCFERRINEIVLFL